MNMHMIKLLYHLPLACKYNYTTVLIIIPGVMNSTLSNDDIINTCTLTHTHTHTQDSATKSGEGLKLSRGENELRKCLGSDTKESLVKSKSL